MPNKHSNIFKKKFSAILLVIIFLFFILELFQRCRYVYRDNSIAPLFYGFKTEQKLISVDKKPGGALFREPFAILEKGKGENILFIGGSSTYGVNNDDFHTFPYLLQSKVNDISCLNAGVPGSVSADYLGMLMRCCREFSIPDMVVFYTGFNDIYWTKKYLVRHKITHMIIRYSFLARTIIEKIIYMDLKKKKDFKYRMHYVKRFEKNIENCIKFAKSKNIDIVLMPEVMIFEKLDASKGMWYPELYSEILEVVKELAHKHHCYFLDPKDVLSADWEGNFGDACHLTDKGSEVFSTFLAKNLPLKKDNVSMLKQ